MREDDLHARFRDALRGAVPGLATADRLCEACVDLLGVDGAAISLIDAGTTHGTYGSSSELSRRLDEFQFTFGEGPCLDAVRLARTVSVRDLADPTEQRWPVYAGAVLAEGVHAVYAVPVAVHAAYVGVLDLFRADPGPLPDAALAGCRVAAELASVPLLDLMDAAADRAAHEADQDVWTRLDTLERVEVYQATGMLIARYGIGPVEALVQLRAYAFSHGRTASEVAWAIVRRELSLDEIDPWPGNNQRTGGEE